MEVYVHMKAQASKRNFKFHSQQPIILHTNFLLIIAILNLEINSSIISDTNYHQLIYGNAYIRIYVDDIFRETRHFTHTDFITYSIFILNYLPGIEGEYLIEVYLDDGFQIYNIETHSFIQGPIPGEYNPEITATIPLAVTFLAVPGVTIIITSKRLGKLKSNSR